MWDSHENWVATLNECSWPSGFLFGEQVSRLSMLELSEIGAVEVSMYSFNPQADSPYPELEGNWSAQFQLQRQENRIGNLRSISVSRKAMLG